LGADVLLHYGELARFVHSRRPIGSQWAFGSAAELLGNYLRKPAVSSRSLQNMSLSSVLNDKVIKEKNLAEERRKEALDAEFNLFVCFQSLGEVSIALGNSSSAIQYFQQALVTAREMAGTPGLTAAETSGAEEKVAVALVNVADALVLSEPGLGEVQLKAVKCRERALEIVNRLATKDIAHSSSLAALRLTVLSKLGREYAVTGDHASLLTEALNSARSIHGLASAEAVQLMLDLATEFEATQNPAKAKEYRDMAKSMAKV